MGSRPAPELLDLGPVVGANVSFFGDRLACKIHVEDLYADLDRHARQGALAKFTEFLTGRLGLPDASVDGILCWDLFDCLPAPAASALAADLTRILRPGGALLALFATEASREPGYTRYVIEDDEHVRCLPHPGAGGRERVLQNRDIIQLFSGLRVAESVLLRVRLREVLFERPAAGAAAGPAPGPPLRATGRR